MAKPPIYDPNKTFFIADLHLGHKNVIKFDDRPFNSIEEHDKVIIDNINDTVPEDCLLIIIGDVTFGDHTKAAFYLDQIKCKMALIKGNHDYFTDKLKNLDKYFIWVKDLITIRIKDETLENKYRRVVLCHYPILSWNHIYRGSYHLHGHCHHNLIPHYGANYILDKLQTPEGIKELKEVCKEKVSPFNFRMDVGLNQWDYTPLSWEQIEAYMATKKFYAIDHHNEDTN